MNLCISLYFHVLPISWLLHKVSYPWVWNILSWPINTACIPPSVPSPPGASTAVSWRTPWPTRIDRCHRGCRFAARWSFCMWMPSRARGALVRRTRRRRIAPPGSLVKKGLDGKRLGSLEECMECFFLFGLFCFPSWQVYFWVGLEF